MANMNERIVIVDNPGFITRILFSFVNIIKDWLIFRKLKG